MQLKQCLLFSFDKNTQRTTWNEELITFAAHGI
jgi:hypothetical protein